MNAIDRAWLIEQFSLQAGGLIEIYVAETSYDEWARTITALEEAGYRVVLTELVSDSPTGFGHHLFEAEGSYRMAVEVGDQTWTSVITSVESMDFQGDPRDVASVDDVDDVLRFMRCIAGVVEKPVALIPETVEPDAVRPYFTIT